VEPPLGPVERLAVVAAVTDVVTRYARAVNQWDLDAFVALFTEDAVWQRPGTDELRGHRAIRAFMESQPTERVLRHVNGGCLVEPVDQTRARAWSQTTVYEVLGTTGVPAPLAGPQLVVEYDDQLVVVSGRWRIARRDTTVVFRAGPPGP
jgi:uncharacterized protein (TIGR02246 family)